jgi:hypothetical protein
VEHICQVCGLQGAEDSSRGVLGHETVYDNVGYQSLGGPCCLHHRGCLR